MSGDNNEATAVNINTVAKIREIILGISPVNFLRSHEPEALAEDTLAAGKADDITPAELAEIIEKGGDLEEDIQRLINERKLKTQVGEIGFNKREMELIGKSFVGTLAFINQVVLPLLENRDEYSSVWSMYGHRDSTWKSMGGIFGNPTDKQDEEKVAAKEILSHLVSEIQMKDPENKTTPLIIETLARILPPQACEEFSNALKDLLAA